MGVTVEAGAGFAVGPPALVIAGSYYVPTSGGTVNGRTYDIAPDGQRSLMIKEGLTQIHVVQNWFEELKARVPTGQ